MTLQTAATARIGSDSRVPTVKDTSLIADVIDAEITRCKAIVGGCYIAYFKFERRITANVIQLKQSDDSYVALSEITAVLSARGFNHFHKFFGTNKVRLTVEWIS